MHKFRIKKGFFLVFTLLLTVLVTSACLVMVQTATMNKSSSVAKVFGENLQNLANQFVRAIANTLNETTPQSFMSTLANQKANLFLADLSGGLPPVVVCNVISSTTAAFGCNPNPPGTANPKSILSLSDKFKIIPPSGSGQAATVSLSPTDAPTANVNSLAIDPILTPTITFTQTSYSSSGATATYGLNIDVQICGTVSGASICQKATVPTNYTFTRSCPNAGKSLDSPSKNMRALTNAEIKALGGSQQYINSNTFPYLYCTCSDAGFGRTRTDGTCAVSCTAGQYANGSSCSPCSATAGCATCTTSATNCTSCKPNYIYDSNSNTCTCPSGFYKDGSGNCNPCNSSCATCSGSATNCTSCSGSSMGLSGGTCSNCATSGKYFVNNTSPCGNCDSSCATCSGSGSNQCLSCKGSVALSSGTCSSCPAGKYFVNNTSPCGNCNSSCATCSGGASNQCTSCNGSMGLSSGTCSSCPAGKYFVNNTSPCGNCDSSCATCSGGGSNQCTSCSGGSMALSAGTCSSCPAGKYFVNNTSPCGNCDSSCATCSGGGSNQCLTCRSGSPVNGTCPSCTGGSVAGGSGVSTGVSNCACPDRTYYWNGSSCVVCPSGSVGSGWSYGPSTPVGSCKCVDIATVWVRKFQVCAFPCESYDTGPYLCNYQSGSPTYGYFCAYCRGSNCIGNSWGSTQNIGISNCTYCPAGQGNC